MEIYKPSPQLNQSKKLHTSHIISIRDKKRGIFHPVPSSFNCWHGFGQAEITIEHHSESWKAKRVFRNRGLLGAGVPKVVNSSPGPSSWYAFQVGSTVLKIMNLLWFNVNSIAIRICTNSIGCGASIIMYLLIIPRKQNIIEYATAWRSQTIDLEIFGAYTCRLVMSSNYPNSRRGPIWICFAWHVTWFVFYTGVKKWAESPLSRIWLFRCV